MECMSMLPSLYCTGLLSFGDVQWWIMILSVLSGMCPVGHRNLFCLSLRLVIFRLQSRYAHDMAHSQSHQQFTLEVGQATHSTAYASISRCTWGTGSCTALAGSWNMVRLHVWAKEMGRISGSHGLDIDRIYLWGEGNPILCSHLLIVCDMRVPSEPTPQWTWFHTVFSQNYSTWNVLKQKLNESEWPYKQLVLDNLVTDTWEMPFSCWKVFPKVPLGCLCLHQLMKILSIFL